MKPVAFEYFAPGSLEEALDLLARHGDDARPLAGGQSLVPAMNFRLARPAVLVDLNEIAELSFIERDEDTLCIGAMTRQYVVESDATVAALSPLLHQAMPWIAHAQIRNRGTIGGSLAHADPAAELPAVALALEATLVARRGTGTRRIAADDFFQGLMTTALDPGELLTAVEFPAVGERTGVAFTEFCRRHGDYAVVGAAARVRLQPDGTVADARLVLLSVSDGPFLATDAADCLQGQRPDDSAIDAAAAAARRQVDPPTDVHATSRYRRHLVRVLSRRVLAAAVADASSGGPAS